MQTQPVPSKTLLAWRSEYSELPGSFLHTGDLALGITPYSANTLPLDVNGPTFFEDLKTFNQETLKSKAFGFSFDTTEVADQYTACCNVMDKYYKALMSGTVDVESTIEQANQEFEAAGLNDIIAAKQEQLDAFLAEQQ